MKPDPHRLLADPAVSAFIRSKARRYAREHPDPATSADDVEQELIERLLRRFPGHDPGRGTVAGFALMVIARAVADLARAQGTEKRRGRPRPIGADLAERLDRDNRRSTDPADAGDRRDLVIDVCRLLAALPADLRSVAAALMGCRTVAAAARRLGRPRTSLYASLAKLRKRFEDAGLAKYLDF